MSKLYNTGFEKSILNNLATMGCEKITVWLVEVLNFLCYYGFVG